MPAASLWLRYKEIVWVVFGQLLAFSGNFFGIKLLTTQMGASGYGHLALGMTIAGMINIFLFGPLGQVIIRYYAVCNERGELPLYFHFSRTMHIYLLFVMVVLASVVPPVVTMYFGTAWGLLTLLAIAFGLLTGVNSSITSLQSAVQQRMTVALHQGADSWLRVVLAFILICSVANTGYIAMAGYLLGTALVTCSQLAFAYRNQNIRPLFSPHPLPDTYRTTYQEFWTYASPFLLFAVFAATSSYADRWILQSTVGIREVGIYTALYQIAGAPVTLLVGIVNQYIAPILFKKAGTMTSRNQRHESSRLLLRTVLITSGLLCAITLIAATAGHWIIMLLTTKEIAEHHALLWKFVLGIGMFNIGQLLVLSGLNHNRSDIYIAPKILQASVLILLGIFMTLRYGMDGMVAALGLSSVVYVCAVLIVNSRLKALTNDF